MVSTTSTNTTGMMFLDTPTTFFPAAPFTNNCCMFGSTTLSTFLNSFSRTQSVHVQMSVGCAPTSNMLRIWLSYTAGCYKYFCHGLTPTTLQMARVKKFPDNKHDDDDDDDDDDEWLYIQVCNIRDWTRDVFFTKDEMLRWICLGLYIHRHISPAFQGLLPRVYKRMFAPRLYPSFSLDRAIHTHAPSRASALPPVHYVWIFNWCKYYILNVLPPVVVKQHIQVSSTFFFF